VHFNETMRDGGFLPAYNTGNYGISGSTALNSLFFLPSSEPTDDKTWLENGLMDLMNAAQRAALVAEKLDGTSPSEAAVETELKGAPSVTPSELPPPEGEMAKCVGAGCVQKYIWPMMFGSVFFITLQSCVVNMINEKQTRIVDMMRDSGIGR